jgi:hypothetical protein
MLGLRARSTVVVAETVHHDDHLCVLVVYWEQGV